MNNPIPTIHLVSAKGGQGVTTTAVALAAQLADRGHTVELVPGDDDSRSDLSAFALPTGVTLVEHQSPNAEPTARVIDGNPSLTADDIGPASSYQRLLVTREDYLALRRATKIEGVDGIIVLADSTRSLCPADVESVLGRPIVSTIPVTPAIARAVDAGLFPRGGEDPLERIVPLSAPV